MPQLYSSQLYLLKPSTGLAFYELLFNASGGPLGNAQTSFQENLEMTELELMLMVQHAYFF
jgi:hypothetical protein